MKTWKIGLLAVPAALLIIGCHGKSRGNFVVLPDGYQSVVCRVDDGNIIPIQQLPFPSKEAVPEYISPPMKSDDSMRVIAAAYDNIDYAASGWITYTADLGRAFMVLKYDFKNGVIRHNDIRMPKGCTAHAATLSGNDLYVGGYCGQTIVGYFDLAADSVAWSPLKIPDSVWTFLKTIDGLLVHNNQLIAVDDALIPGWLFRYDITNPASPVLLDAKKVKSHGENEHISKSVIGSRWAGTLSTTSGNGILREYIALYDVDSLIEIGSIVKEATAHTDTGDSEPAHDIEPSWESIEIYDDILLIAARDRGMAIIDLSSIDKSKEVSAQLEEGLTYRKYIAYPESSYLNFMLVPPLDKVAVIIARADSLDHILLSREELLTPDLWVTAKP